MEEAGGGGGLRVRIGHHKIGACAEIGQNRIKGDGGVKRHKNVGHHLCTFPKLEMRGGCEISRSHSCVSNMSKSHIIWFCFQFYSSFACTWIKAFILYLIEKGDIN